jgi:hypothetical protein
MKASGFGLLVPIVRSTETDSFASSNRRFLKKIATRDRVESLQRALDKALSEEAGIRAKKWWTDEGFNKPNGNSG